MLHFPLLCLLCNQEVQPIYEEVNYDQSIDEGLLAQVEAAKLDEKAAAFSSALPPLQPTPYFKSVKVASSVTARFPSS